MQNTSQVGRRVSALYINDHLIFIANNIHLQITNNYFHKMLGKFRLAANLPATFLVLEPFRTTPYHLALNYSSCNSPSISLLSMILPALRCAVWCCQRFFSVTRAFPPRKPTARYKIT